MSRFATCLNHVLPVWALLALSTTAFAQSAAVVAPATVTAGSSFTITTSGVAAPASLLIVGPAGSLSREIKVGEAVPVSSIDLYSAGHYLVILSEGASVETTAFDMVPDSRVSSLSFLAQPSRLPVGLHNAVSGTAYVFDAYRNLVTAPVPVSFQLSTDGTAAQVRTVTTRNGMAWTAMDSAPREGVAKFIARTGDVSTTRIVDEVPGDPCGLTMTARPDGQKVSLETAPLKDCKGNPVPDGTIVTFTESYNGMQSTVDAPLKQGIARAEMPSRAGAKISVASGVVAGNEIRWEGGR